MSSVAAVALSATLAIVVQDATPLKGAPKDSAPTQALLTQGDVVEVRGLRCPSSFCREVTGMDTSAMRRPKA